VTIAPPPVAPAQSDATASLRKRREPGSDTTTDGIRVVVTPSFLPEHSDAKQRKYTFAYRIRITNTSERVVTLLRRQWMIVDSEGDRKVVSGDGVVGQQPTLTPGAHFEYNSYCPLSQPWGTMEGTFAFATEHGESIAARVGRFFLVSPHV
jgi:ApaG protein